MEHVDGFAPDQEYDYCTACKLPLPKRRENFRRIANKDYCQSCFELHEVVAGSQYMVERQAEWREQQKQIERLKPGSDYFQK